VAQAVESLFLAVELFESEQKLLFCAQSVVFFDSYRLARSSSQSALIGQSPICTRRRLRICPFTAIRSIITSVSAAGGDHYL
jgi:hypothetical protein